MTKKRKRQIRRALMYAFLIAIGYLMIYPLLWMFFGAFKSNAELFGTMRLLPTAWDTTGFVKGWKGSGFYNYSDYFLNTLKMSLPCVFLSMLSSVLVAYGFTRFDFAGKKLFFTLMISTMLLPGTTMIIPRYIMFNKIGWLDTYWPFIAPMALATVAFNNFMLITFFRDLPESLDEAATIDGANSWQILWRIYMPLSITPIITVGLFTFIGNWNNFFEPLIYISSQKKYTLPLALQMTFNQAQVEWNRALAMSFVSTIPLIVLFLFTQRFFMQGISTTGMKE